MPRLTRWLIKTSLVYLLLGLALGLLLTLRPVLGLPASLLPVYTHFLVLGWLTQLIFGVVFWMFPKYSQEKPRGSEALGWWTYALLNLGLILRAFAEPVNSAEPNGLWGWLLALSATLLFASGLCFVANTWSRVRER